MANSMRNEECENREPPLVYWNTWRRSPAVPAPAAPLNVYRTTRPPPATPYARYAVHPPRYFGGSNRYVNGLTTASYSGSPAWPSPCYPTEARQMTLPATVVKQEPPDETDAGNGYEFPTTSNDNFLPSSSGMSSGCSDFLNDIKLEPVAMGGRFPVTASHDLIYHSAATDQHLISSKDDQMNMFAATGDSSNMDTLPQSMRPCSSSAAPGALPQQGMDNVSMVAANKNDEVIKAAKSLFSKRTRTLYHWLYPNTSKNKIKAIVSATWDTLSDSEKHFYISQVLGRFGLRASSLMVNPQLGGHAASSNISQKPAASTSTVTTNKKQAKQEDDSKTKLQEDQAAVDSLFESCDDSSNWASYSKEKDKKNGGRKKGKRGKYRKKHPNDESEKDDISILANDPDLLEELKALKKLRQSCKDIEDLKNDNDLTKQIIKFRMMSEQIEDEFWNDTCVDPDDLFAGLDL